MNLPRAMCFACLTALLGAAGLESPALAAPPVTLESLLDEMIDRSAIARLPDPWYTCSQASSYDRRSTTPDDPETWFANADASQFIRMETNDGRREWVMMDAQGPGAVVRIWSANPKGTLRLYLDGSTAPALEAPMDALLGGKWTVGDFTLGEPLSATRSRGWNLYLPIPYAKHCKITSDADGFYYQINYRTYDAGAAVATFALDQLTAAAEHVDRVQAALAAPELRVLAEKQMGRSLGPWEQVIVTLPPGPRAVNLFICRITSDDLPSALRSTILSSAFDAKQTIWCPAGDFGGSGVGVNPFSDWFRSVEQDPSALLTSRWIMPYERSGAFVVENHSDKPIVVQIVVNTIPWEWDDRSMHFHARWRQENPLPTRPMRDWNYIAIEGQGVYVGDSLAVANPTETWWGEGDEKIYVDGETFPSHFGTGTEDYYGYAWCCPETFAGPFHAQPRCDGPGNYGHTVVSRVRLLDGIPFRKSLRFDMEVWHWEDTNVGYAATTYYYARPGAKDNRRPVDAEIRRGILSPPPLPPPFAVENAIECESLPVSGHSEDLTFGPQNMRGFARNAWSGDTHLWIRATETGEYIELDIPCKSADPVRLTLHATKSWDYGIVQFSVNGRPAGKPIDFFSGGQGVCKATGPIDLGTFKPENGRLRLRAEVVGGHPDALGSKTFFGLDCVVLEAP